MSGLSSVRREVRQVRLIATGCPSCPPVRAVGPRLREDDGMFGWFRGWRSVLWQSSWRPFAEQRKRLE